MPPSPWQVCTWLLACLLAAELFYTCGLASLITMLSVETPECWPSELVLIIQCGLKLITHNLSLYRERGACYVPDRQSFRHPFPLSLATLGDREHALLVYRTEEGPERWAQGPESPSYAETCIRPTACIPAPAPPPTSPPPCLSHATCPQAAVRTWPWRLHLNSVQKGSSNSRNRSESLGQ